MVQAAPRSAAADLAADPTHSVNGGLNAPASEFLQGEAFTLLQAVFKHRNVLVTSPNAIISDSSLSLIR